MISHRFSTVRVADRICVVQEGRVAESGSHDELIAHGGRYAELFELRPPATARCDKLGVHMTGEGPCGKL